MKKNIIVLVILSLLLVSVFATIAVAGPVDRIKENKFLKWIFVDINEGLSKEGAESVQSLMAVRLILAILLFALFYGVLQLVLADFKQGPRMGIAIALALLASIGVPKQWLLALIGAFGGVVTFVIIAALVLGCMYLAFVVFNEPTRFHYFAKLILFFIAAYLTGVMGASGTAPGAAATEVYFTGFGSGLWKAVAEIFDWATWIFWIMFGYYIVKVIWPGAPAAPEEAATAVAGTEPAAATGRRIKRWWRRRGRPEFTSMRGLVDDLDTAVDNKNVGEVNATVASIRDVDKRIENLETWSYKAADKLPEASDRRAAKSKIREALAAHRDMSKDLKSIRGITRGKSELNASEWKKVKGHAGDVATNFKVAESEELEFLDMVSEE